MTTTCKTDKDEKLYPRNVQGSTSSGYYISDAGDSNRLALDLTFSQNNTFHQRYKNITKLAVKKDKERKT
jgi:hypothetical protein